LKSLVRSEQARLWWLLVGVAAMFAFSMGTHPFIPSMEPRFGEVIREMLARGEYLIPIKNGVPYVEYPPLYYWLSLAGHFVGLPETVAIRLPAAVAFVLWIFWLSRLQRSVRPGWRIYWLPLVGAALPGVLYHFFVAQSDSVLILGTLIGLTGYWRLRQRVGQGQGGGFPWELWLGVTLATMAKGPVGLMVTLPVIALDIMLEPVAAAEGTWWRAVWRRAGYTAWVRGLGLVLLFNSPWYIAVGLRDGWDLVRAMVVYQNFTRFLVGFDHLQPWWYYGKTIWYDMLPMAFALPFALILGWRRRRERLWRLPLVWILWTVLFFSVSASKQGKYILTAAPSVALLGLLTVETLCSARWWKRLRIAAQAWAILLLATFAGAAVFVLPHYSDRVGGIGGLRLVRDIVQDNPGKVVSYAWPRAMELYVLGAPMPYVRSARELYTWIREGRLQPGDYLLVLSRHLPEPGQMPGATTLSPPPAYPYFQRVISVHFNGVLDVFRVLPAASDMSMPKTPEPPTHHWWDRFDTD